MTLLAQGFIFVEKRSGTHPKPARKNAGVTT
jgi:hypothetical protein